VGVHGAGLVWSGFKSLHSGLIEVFGADCCSGNRYYHSISSLADIHYPEMHAQGSAVSLTWNADTLGEIVKMIQHVNLDKVPH
jgi:hypothetical protein